jgi:hypothetical protein
MESSTNTQSLIDQSERVFVFLVITPSYERLLEDVSRLQAIFRREKRQILSYFKGANSRDSSHQIFDAKTTARKPLI